MGGAGSRRRAAARTTGSDEPIDILMKVETHNHPTAISPFPGAATGSGGEIRDEGATGRGAKPKAGLAGFTVSNLRIPGAVQPWEQDLGQARPHRVGAGDHARRPDRRGGLQQRVRPAEHLRLFPHLRAARRVGRPLAAARLPQADHDRGRPRQHPPPARREGRDRAGLQDRGARRAGDADRPRRRRGLVGGQRAPVPPTSTSPRCSAAIRRCSAAPRK